MELAGHGWKWLEMGWPYNSFGNLGIRGFGDLKIGDWGNSNWVRHNQVSWSSLKSSGFFFQLGSSFCLQMACTIPLNNSGWIGKFLFDITHLLLSSTVYSNWNNLDYSKAAKLKRYHMKDNGHSYPFSENAFSYIRSLSRVESKFRILSHLLRAGSPWNPCSIFKRTTYSERSW